MRARRIEKKKEREKKTWDKFVGRTVHSLGLKKQARVGVADARQQQSFGIIRVGRNDNLKKKKKKKKKERRVVREKRKRMRRQEKGKKEERGGGEGEKERKNKP